VPTPRQRVARLLGRRSPGEAPPPGERTLLQVLIGAFFGGALAGGVAALLGSQAVSAIVFGFLIGVLFLWMDLRARDKAGGPPPPAV